MQLTFLGAAGEVTGSCYLLETEDWRMLVDCGMFQGGREADRKNRTAFNFDPETIDCVLLTHAHIDHSGLLPRLSAWGFRGPVYTTSATNDLLHVMLKDSAHIQEKETEWHNRARRGRSRSGSSLQEYAPLYTVAQAENFLKQLRSVKYNTEHFPLPGVRCIFRDAGHILGSAIIELWLTEGSKTKKIVFSGDLGQPGHPIVRDPTPIHSADILLVESTYGNRLHRSMTDTLDELVYAINDTLVDKGGNVIIPAFTVGRTQDLLFLLIDLYREGRLGEMEIYVDSPMALAATGITMKHIAMLDRESQEAMQWMRANDKKPRIQFIQDVEESMQLNMIQRGAIIISASGMCDAGRIKHHLKYNLNRPECSIVITGFQAARTLGRRLVDGAKVVKIFGQEIAVRADIYTIGGLSAHADQKALLGWLSHFKKPPIKTFVVHGEPSSAAALATAIQDTLQWRDVAIPAQKAVVTL
ncbi:MBL fold metallo-hydrolase RNA specificity domain-containing protein [Nitrosomonas sp.]|uniref:MBL fold metallo-hydrolase RNA specificity domain-containing protein n=1 Tax=Nitrosomonas sp. TaxID=42353 RepID=UPI001D6F8EDC|nr:MBL fold metallo-hydrolase [Nitrosomonas sp.]MCB1947732.1 MBL fold metallo-hydrolase [Nitrosomonas sp.]MCP5242078.1 MBL fold metallo-hydrolase [Burkholderiales bacterium]MCP5291620.1 MBL fold metallo-hydrolase [Burkholderiales bacterium]MDR4514272.1 MBL fold metallo-hydrolase [Nitrosomonas sp.]